MARKMKEDRTITDLYCKPADDHQSLHYDLCHADHMKRLIIFSQKLRLKRLCSEKNDLNAHVEDLKIYGFVKGGILIILSRNRLKRPLGSLQMMKIIAKKMNGVPLIVTNLS